MNNRHLGFTGTQRGLKEPQAICLTIVLRAAVHEHNYLWMHNGDCIGADTHAANLWKGKIHLHPPIIEFKRAYIAADIVEKPFPYLERNHHIVDASELLVATPGEMEEQLRSGTWATIRYAKKTQKTIILVFPDGSVRNG